MANKFKQLFCEHVWKRTDRELLDEYDVVIEDKTYWAVKEWGLTYVCIKCGKTEVKMRKERTYPRQ